MIVSILDQNLKQKPPYVLGAEVVLLLVIGVALRLLPPLLSPVQVTMLTVFTLASALAGNMADLDS